MKIVLYSHDWAPTIGGVQAITMSLARGMAAAGCKVAVVTNTASDGMDDAALPFHVVRRPNRFSLLRLLRGADVIHLAGPAFFPLLAGWLLGKPTIVEHHGYYAACPNGLLFHHPSERVCPGHFLARRYGKCVQCNAVNVGSWKSLRLLLGTFPRRWLSSRATRNVGPSDHVVTRVALPRIETIYHGIVMEPMPARASEIPRPVQFAFVGRFVREKGVSILLHAARLLADQGCLFGLKIIGDGPERGRLEDLRDELHLGDRVVFTGPLKGSNLQAALGDVAALVMPSLWEEVAPVAAIETMMQGRVLIATDLGGLGEYVGDAGLKFAPGDASALANCLRRVLEHPEIIRERGAAAHERAMGLFQQERMVEEHLQLYRRLLAPKSPAEKALARL